MKLLAWIQKRGPGNPTRRGFAFKRDRLPNPAEYCRRRSEGVASQSIEVEVLNG